MSFSSSGVTTMKMISSTSTTSTSGVTLMSEFGRPAGLTENFVCLRVRHGAPATSSVSSTPSAIALAPALRRDVHHLAHVAEGQRCSSPLSRTCRPGSARASPQRVLRSSASSYGVLLEVDLLRPAVTESDQRVGLLASPSRCACAFGRCTSLPALEHRRDHHEDDQQHQHDVDQRRDVDVALDAALGTACRHRHGRTVRPLPEELDCRPCGACAAELLGDHVEELVRRLGDVDRAGVHPARRKL